MYREKEKVEAGVECFRVGGRKAACEIPVEGEE
jgi:hypothetical protein